jgi:hypothetical protein
VLVEPPTSTPTPFPAMPVVVVLLPPVLKLELFPPVFEDVQTLVFTTVVLD